LFCVSLVSLPGDLFCDGGRNQNFKTSELSRILTYPLVLKMPSRYYLLEDLPHLTEIHYTKIIKEIIVLSNKLKEIEAIKKYFARNFLFELKTIIQKKGKFNKNLKTLLLQFFTVIGNFNYI